MLGFCGEYFDGILGRASGSGRAGKSLSSRRRGHVRLYIGAMSKLEVIVCKILMMVANDFRDINM